MFWLGECKSQGQRDCSVLSLKKAYKAIFYFSPKGGIIEMVSQQQMPKFSTRISACIKKGIQCDMSILCLTTGSGEVGEHLSGIIDLIDKAPALTANVEAKDNDR